MSNAVPQKKTFFQIANKNFIMLFVAYTVICITHSMTNSVTSAGWRQPVCWFHCGFGWCLPFPITPWVSRISVSSGKLI